MEWSTDFTDCPRGVEETTIRVVKVNGVEQQRTYKEFKPAHVWTASKCGKVILSYWIPDQNRWCGYTEKTLPVAWHPYFKPEFPAHLIEGGAA